MRHSVKFPSLQRQLSRWMSRGLRWVFLATLLPNIVLAVPTAVEKSFAEKYPDVTEVEWEQDSHDYWEGKFTVDKIRYRADFEEDGTWVETENSLDFQDLPRSIRNAILEEFPNEEISELEFTDNAERGELYDVEFLRNGEKFDVEFRQDAFFVETYNEDTGTWEELINIRENQLDVDALNWNEFFREFGVNLLFALIYAGFIYFPRHGDTEMLFLLLGFNLFLFPVLILSTGFSASIGFTIFAMLALVRLRSDSMSKIDVAYLLGAVSLTFVNALLVVRLSIPASLVVVVTAFLADHPMIRRHSSQVLPVRYRSSDTTKLLDRAFLRKQISSDYNIKVTRIKFEALQKDEVRLLVFYREPNRKQEGGS